MNRRAGRQADRWAVELVIEIKQTKKDFIAGKTITNTTSLRFIKIK